MFCTSCGAQVEEGSKFCDKCGASLEMTNYTTQVNSQQGYVNNQQDYSTNQQGYVNNQQSYANNHRVYADDRNTVSRPPQRKEKQVAPAKKKGGPSTGTLVVVIVTTLLLIIGTATVILLFVFKGNNEEEVSSGPIAFSTPALVDEETAVIEGETPGSNNENEIADAVEATMAAQNEINQSVEATQAAINAQATQAAIERDAIATQAAVQAASEYIIPDSDSRYLTIDDLRGLTKDECRYARNEIVARNGRKFKDRELQAYFDSKSWYYGYIEADQFNENTMLNDYERENMYLIKDYENNYNSYN